MKTSKISAILLVVLGLMVWQVDFSEAAPMGTAWTYQGRLIDANDAADGLYDFQFKLFDDANTATGNQLGSTIDVNDLDVIDGYFTAELDLGSDVFDGDARWLEVGVRPGDSNDPNAFVSLSPRQEITPVPYALQTRGIFVDNSGNVGIGTTNPSQKLEVDGIVKAGIVKASSFSDCDNPSYYLAPAMNSNLYSLQATSMQCFDLEVQGLATLRDLTVDGGAGMHLLTLHELWVQGPVYMPWVFGNSITGQDVMVKSDGELGTLSSSRRYKENIAPLEEDFTKILGARPVAFVWKESKEPDIGLIAEDMDELGLRNLVFYDAEGRPESVRYKFISLYLLEVLKDQANSIKELKAENELLKEQLKAENQSLKQRLGALEKTVQEIAKAKEVKL